MKTLYSILLLCISFNISAQHSKSIIKIKKQKHLTDLPSASGVEIINNEIYVIGDDSPYLYHLNNNFSIIDKILLTGNDSTTNGRVPKAIKSDFESMASFYFENEIVFAVLSSGSKEVTRDTIHIISLPKKKILFSKNIRPLFDVIRAKANFTETDEINIEALAINETNVFMMQRGNNNENIIISFNRDNFLDFVFTEDGKLPEFKIYWFTLPSLDKTVSGFSGACILPNNSGLLFTASLEATTDAYSDGEILGSYIGIIDFSNINKRTHKTELIKHENTPIKTKLEGISVRTIDENQATVIAVSDNDDGTSWIYEIEIDIKQLFNK